MNRRATLTVMVLVLRGSRSTVKSLVPIACIVASLAAGGCGAAGADLARYGESMKDPLVREALADMGAFQTVTRDSVTVYHPGDLAPQAQYFAALTARQLSYLEEETGFQQRLPQLNLYLVPKGGPHKVFRARGFLGHVWDFALYVRPEDQSCKGIVAANIEYPYVLIHELVEFSFYRKLLSDHRWKTFWGGEKERFHFTRWFRDGFANYAGFLTYKMTVFDDGFARENRPIGAYQESIHRHPFSLLARVGKDLFTWHQFYEEPTPREWNPNLPHVGNTNIDHYGAALGLFLVVEDRYGRDAIKDIMENVYRLEDGDGEAVKEIVSRALGTDIVKLVEEFRFPETGLYMDAFWPGHNAHVSPGLSTEEGLFVQLVGADSPAQRAGIRKGDVVVSLDGQRTVTNLDFEFALYERMHQKDVTVGIWREGVGTISIQLKLEE